MSDTRTLVVCGAGLAGLMTAAALANATGPLHHILLIDLDQSHNEDILYGSVTHPTSYDFLRGLGLDEPTLFLKSSTSFSFGTQYKSWPSTNAAWLQAHHQPLPTIEGVPLHHYLKGTDHALEPLLVSALAALAGKFAHPPEDRSVALSRAEYGYQFNVTEWNKLLSDLVDHVRVERIDASVESVETSNGQIVALNLSSGARVEGAIFIDCTGASRALVSALEADFAADRVISASSHLEPNEQLGPPCRHVEATHTGWTARTHLQNSAQTLTVASGDNSQTTDRTVIQELGRVGKAWHGNCVAIGHSASILEPLTPAPMVMLQRDIERLLELLPVSRDLSFESAEFNRRFDNDYRNAKMFNDAFYHCAELPETDFWQQARQSANDADLERKISHYENRGTLVKYDLEPFHDEDWLILHSGMDRKIKHQDLQAERASKEAINRQLSDMARAVAQMVDRLPPHHLYVSKMKSYLEKQANV